MAQGMDAFLAEHYGTDAAVKTAAANQEDLEKQASVDLFMKLAAEQNIDLAAMKPEQVNELYARFIKNASAPEAAAPVTKTAEEEEAEKKKELEEKAKEEHEEKKAQAEKVAEADFLGRVMAHAYCNEMRKIAEAAAAGEAPAADPAPAAAPAAEDPAKLAAMPENLRKGFEALKGHAGKAGKAVSEAAGKGKEHVEHAAGKAHEFGKSHPGATHGAAAAGGAAAGAGAAHAAHKHHDKEASAIDALAAEQSVRVAHEQGWDAEQAGRKIAAVLELGLLKPSEKTASAPDVATAVGIRALEMLEAAGYPVTWE
jgi:hypothetical protein